MAGRTSPTRRANLISKRAQSRTNSARLALEARLSRVLTGIATVLIASGYSHTSLNRLSRAAFVSAAVLLLRDGTRKVSVARIAASTGLSRIEVSTILKQKNAALGRGVDTKNRSSNVALGWISDRDFLDFSGRPRTLLFRGGKSDFAALVKRYSRDIPARAMLVEMRRLGMVIESPPNRLRLIKSIHEVSRLSASAIRAVEPWMTMLGDTVLQSPKANLSAKTTQVDLHFDSIRQVNAVLNDLHKKRAAFVEGLSELGARGKNDSKLSLRVTIALAVARPQRTKPMVR